MLRELKVGVHGLVEKSEYVEAIVDAQIAAVESGTTSSCCGPISQLFRRPTVLVRHDLAEPLAKAALRLGFADASRTAITVEELISFKWHVRLRCDGPLASEVERDPWWLGKGNGVATFAPDGRLSFEWPPNPDPDAEYPTINPFDGLGIRTDMLGWQIEHGGNIVTLLFSGQPGPNELVCRHPQHWGWILYSQGTVWTSWKMPGLENGVCKDPLLREQNLKNLPCGTVRDY